MTEGKLKYHILEKDNNILFYEEIKVLRQALSEGSELLQSSAINHNNQPMYIIYVNVNPKGQNAVVKADFVRR